VRELGRERRIIGAADQSIERVAELHERHNVEATTSNPDAVNGAAIAGVTGATGAATAAVTATGAAGAATAAACTSTATAGALWTTEAASAATAITGAVSAIVTGAATVSDCGAGLAIATDNVATSGAAFRAACGRTVTLRRAGLRLREKGNSFGNRPFIIHLSETRWLWFRLCRF